MAGGEDFVEGRNCHDTVNGGEQGDNVGGDAGEDVMKGQAHNERPNQCGPFACGRVSGGTGNDTVYGNDGADLVLDNIGENDIDGVSGGDGDDETDTDGGEGDDINDGGPGQDDCHYDLGDTKISCP